MKKSILLSVIALVLLVPAVFAVTTYTFNTVMQSTLITQGYQFARIQGVNTASQPIGIISWSMSVDLGLSMATCQFQPTFLVPNGPYEVIVPIQCQTRSGMTSLFPTGTTVKTEVHVPDNVNPGSFTVDKVWIETRPQVRSPFPVAPFVQQPLSAGFAVRDPIIPGRSYRSLSSTLLFAGMGAIVVLTIAVIFFALKRDE